MEPVAKIETKSFDKTPNEKDFPQGIAGCWMLDTTSSIPRNCQAAIRIYF